MSVLVMHSHMRKRLIEEDVSPFDIVRMKRDDFMSVELRKQKSIAEEERLNAQRTDWARAQDMKAGYADSFFTCKKCKSKKTSYY